MEEKLARYRAGKKKEGTNDSFLLKFFQVGNRTEKTDCKIAGTETNLNQSTPLSERDILKDGLPEKSESKTSWTRVDVTLLLLKLTLWLILFALCIEHEFGAVYFVLSFIYFIYKSTGVGKKRGKSLSAYSVFNPNFERIDGTFTTEQFEKELRYGAGSVK